MPYRVHPLRSLSVALVLSTSLTAPILAQTVTYPAGPLADPPAEPSYVDVFHSSATVTSSGYGFYFVDGVGTAVLFSTGSIVSTADAFYVSHGDVGSIANYGDITSNAGDGISVANGVTGWFYNSGIIMGLDSSHGKTVDLDGGVTGTFENAGSIYGANRAIDFDAHVETFINSGDIEADAVFDIGYQFGSGIDANTITTFSNSGTIWSAGRTIHATGITSFTNSGRIRASNPAGGEAVYVGGNVGIFTNSGAIEATGSGDGVSVIGTVGSFTNQTGGTIKSATGKAVDFDGAITTFVNNGTIESAYKGIDLDSDTGSFTNTGTIKGGTGQAVDAANHQFATFVNTGTIQSTSYQAIDAGGFDSFINTGTIRTDGARAVQAFYNRTESFFNSGTILATNDLAVDLGAVGSFTNTSTGVIETGGNNSVWLSSTTDRFVNLGRIATTGGTASAVHLNDTVGSFINSGTISSIGGAGISVVRTGTGPFINDVGGTISGDEHGAYFYYGGPTFENRGTVTGNVGVGFSSYSTMSAKLINSGTIQGTGGLAIDFSDSTANNALDDILELRTGSRILGRVDFAEGSDTLDVSGYQGNTVLTVASLETVTTGSRLVNTQLDGSGDGTVSIIDGTGITGGGTAALGEVAGAIGGEIAGALGGIGGTSGGPEPLGYAPARPQGAAEAATDELAATANPTGPEVWGKAFGGIIGKTNEYGAVLGGVVAGSHVAVNASTRLGGVVSVSGARFATTGDGQVVTSTIGSLGLYGSTDLGGLTLSYSVLGGVAANHSDRTVTALVTETARADFSSWYWSPEIGVSIPVPLLDGVETDAGFKLRYIGGGVGGYTETGSSQNLTVGASSLNLLDARAEFSSKMAVASTDYGDIMLSGTAGVMALHNFGSSVSIAGFPLATTAAGTALGVYGDVTVEAPVGPTAKASASAGVEARTDAVSSASANVGLSAAF